MRVLITYGSTRGGTEGIARALQEALVEAGVSAELASADTAPGLDGFDAVIVGGALYANRWHREARRFVTRHTAALRRVPVWMFSSGPLDDSGATTEIPPPHQVVGLMQRIGALGHKTFGGRLTADAKGLAASAMAKTRSGDWRDWQRIRAWANELATALPSARPGTVARPSPHALSRLLGHAVAGAAITTMILAGFGGHSPTWLAAVLATAVFANVAHRYFLKPGAREPVPTAFVFAAVLGGLQLALHYTGVLTASLIGIWIPVLLVGVITTALGALLSMRPSATPART